MRKMLFFACLLLGLSACEKDPDMNQLDADLVVYTDYDKDADFGGYKTYFLPDSILEAGGHRATYWKDENAKAIINKVAAEMDARGYTRILDPEKKEEANVGLQLSYVAQTTQVITGAYWGGWWAKTYDILANEFDMYRLTLDDLNNALKKLMVNR